MQCFSNAVLKQMLKAVDPTGGLLAKVIGDVAQSLGGFGQALLCFSLAFALKGQTIIDQSFNGFGSLFLSFGHGT